MSDTPTNKRITKVDRYWLRPGRSTVQHSSLQTAGLLAEFTSPCVLRSGKVTPAFLCRGC